MMRLLACWADWVQAAGFTLDTILAGFAASAAVFKGSKTAKAPLGAGGLFIRYLQKQGTLPPPSRRPSPTETWPILGAFRAWMRSQRGVADSTLDTYQTTLVDLLKALGDDPKAFTAHAMRAFVLERAKPHSRGRAKSIAMRPARSSDSWSRPGNAPWDGTTPFHDLLTGSWHRSQDSSLPTISSVPLALARGKPVAR